MAHLFKSRTECMCVSVFVCVTLTDDEGDVDGKGGGFTRKRKNVVHVLQAWNHICQHRNNNSLFLHSTRKK